MAFSDLISKDVAAPLAGFDKAVATGFELAQNQQKLGMAQQQIQLQQEQISQGYLEKATSLFPHFMRANGGTRKALGNAITQMMGKAGLGVDQETLMLLNSDEQLNAQASQYLSQLQKEFPNNPAMIAARMGEFLQQPASDIYTAMTKAVGQEAAVKAAASRAFLQRVGIKETAVAGKKLQRIYKLSDEVNKTTEETSKQLGTVVRSISNIESALKSNDYKRLETIIGDLAKGVGGLSGVLSDLDMKTQLARSLGTDLAGLEGYFFGKATIPKETFRQINDRMNDFKQSLTDEATGKLLNQITNKQMDPTIGPAFQVKSGPQGLQIGFASARLIDRSNKVLQQLKTARGEIVLDDWIKKQAAPPTSSQINKAIQDAAKQRLIIRFPESAVIPLPSEEEIYGLVPGQATDLGEEE